jgi:cytoskeleton protein RodZ
MADVKTHPEAEAAQGAREGFGAQIKKAREEQGISVGDMAARSRLSVQQVEAIEAENTAQLPEPVYVRAFLRGLAQELGLKPEPLVADYMQRYGGGSKDFGMLPDHDPGRETVVSARPAHGAFKIIAALVLLIVLVIVAWQFWTSSFGKGETTLTEAEKVAAGIDEKDAAKASAAKAAAEDAAKNPDAAAPAAPEEKTAEVAITPPEPAPAAAPEAPKAEQPAQPAAEQPKAESEPAMHKLSFVARQRCWTEVRAPDGTKLFEKTLQPGEKAELSVPPGARVVLGNGHGAAVTVDGKPYEVGTLRTGVARFSLK